MLFHKQEILEFQLCRSIICLANTLPNTVIITRTVPPKLTTHIVSKNLLFSLWDLCENCLLCHSCHLSIYEALQITSVQTSNRLRSNYWTFFKIRQLSNDSSYSDILLSVRPACLLKLIFTSFDPQKWHVYLRLTTFCLHSFRTCATFLWSAVISRAYCWLWQITIPQESK